MNGIITTSLAQGLQAQTRAYASYPSNSKSTFSEWWKAQKGSDQVKASNKILTLKTEKEKEFVARLKSETKSFESQRSATQRPTNEEIFYECDSLVKTSPSFFLFFFE